MTMISRISKYSNLALRCNAAPLTYWIPESRQWQRMCRSSSTHRQTDDLCTAEQRKQDHKHCVEMVRTRDMEGYLCGLLMPWSAREAYFALRAFNAEIAGIKDASKLVAGRSRGSCATASTSRFEDNVTDIGKGDSSLASRLRIQWWVDSVANMYEDFRSFDADSTSRPPRDLILRSLTSSRKHNPTLRSLNHAIHAHGLTHRFLRRIMEAREADLEVTQYQSIQDVAQYGEDVFSSMLYLSLESVGVRDESADRVASDIGVGMGILTSLRSTGFRATQGECSIPADLAFKHYVTMDTVWTAWDVSVQPTHEATIMEEAALSHDKLRCATLEMVDMAAFHLHRARENQSAVAKEGRPCLLPAVCGLQYLEVLKQCNYDVLHPSLVGDSENIAEPARTRRLSLMYLLGRTWLTGTF